ncbi:hypothetical protein P3T76_010251 [Phytophthora citrophthora]|uniref:Uncharacterized protein n=1 Tax=Phytophthora citrophthora TaxID=4793 RepID=A0AAD9LGL2_9STRA|nr:hypothetical protein P3T76_010251 [Phytophthora citrophthora]
MGVSAIPEGVQLLDMFLKDMDELDADSVQDDPNGILNSAHTRSFESPANTFCSQDTNVHLNVAAPLTTRKKKHSWLRRREELHRLRQETQAMETRVVFLRLQRQNRQASCGFQQKRKEATTTEQQQLKKAQQENSELKNKVRASAASRRTASCLSSDVSSAANPIQAAIEEPLPVAFRIDSESAGIFTTLEAIVDRRFQDLQSILDKLQLKSTAVDDVEVHISNGDSGTKAAMEYKCVQVLPFDNVVASKTVWSLVEVCNNPQKLSQVVQRSENTYSARSRFTLHLDEDTMLFAYVYTVVNAMLYVKAV